MEMTDDKFRAIIKKRLENGSLTRDEAVLAFKKWQASKGPQQLAVQTPPLQPIAEGATASGGVMPQMAPEGAQFQPGFKEKKQMSFAELADPITGESQRVPSTEALPLWTEMPMAEGTFSNVAKSLPVMLSTVATGPEETANILVANLPEGAYKRPDEKGNWVVYNPITKQEYAMNRPGLDWQDVQSMGAAGARDLLLTKGLGVAGKAASAFSPVATKLLSFFPKATTVAGSVLQGGAVDTMTQAGQVAMGSGEGLLESAMNVGAGAIINVGGRSTGKIAEASVDSVKYPSLLRQAQQGDQEAIKMLQDIKVRDPEGLKVAMDAVNLEDVSPTGAFKFKDETMDEALASLGKSGHKDAQRLADTIKTDPTFLKFLQDNDLMKFVTSRELVDVADTETLKWFDSMASVVAEGNDLSMNDLMKSKLKGITDQFSKIIQGIGGKGDLGEASNAVQDVLENKLSIMQNAVDSKYASLRSLVPKDLPAKADNTLDYITERAKALGKGNINAGLKELSEIERKAYRSLTDAGESVVDIGTGVRRMVGVPGYTALDELRKDAGDLIKAGFQDRDSGAAKKLYGLLSKDIESTLKDPSVPPEVFAKYKGAQALVKGVKAMQDDMTALFGKAFAKELNEAGAETVGNEAVTITQGAIKKAVKSEVSPFIRLMSRVPKKERKGFMIDALFGATPEKIDVFDFKNFADISSKLKGKPNLRNYVGATIGKDAMDVIENLGTLSESIHRNLGGGKLADRSPADLKMIAEEKIGLLHKIVNSAAGYFLGSSMVQGVKKIGGGTIGSTTAGYTTGNSVKLALNALATGDDRYKHLVTLLKSPELKSAMEGTLGPRQMAELSKSQALTRFLDSAGVAKSTKDIELFLQGALKVDEDK